MHLVTFSRVLMEGVADTVLQYCDICRYGKFVSFLLSTNMRQ